MIATERQIELSEERDGGRVWSLWRREGQRAWEAVSSPRLYIALAAAAVLFVLAYSVQPTYLIDVGGLFDTPFVSGMHAVEQNPEFTYRWTTEDSLTVLPGLGRQAYNVNLKLQGWRPEGQTSPTVKVLVNGKAVGVIQTAPSLQTYTMEVKADQVEWGDLAIELRAETFQPKGDSRGLGVAVDWIEVKPVSGRSSFPFPPPAQIGYLLASVGLVYLSLGQLRVSKGRAMLVALGFAVALAVLLVMCREWLTIFTGPLAVIMLISFLLALVSLLAVAWLRARRRVVVPEWQIGALVGLFVIGFIVRYGGVVYPQFLSSDLGFHVHRLEWVLSGRLIFSAPLPGDVERLAPYPPAYYLVLTPFAWIVQDRSLLLRFVTSVMDASSVFVLFYLLRKLRGDGLGGLMAGVVYTFSPMGFLMLSAGNYTNIFGQWISLLLFAALALATQACRRRLLVFSGLTLLVLLTFTSHYGILLTAFGAVGVLVLYVAAFSPGARRLNAVYLGLSFVAALAAAYVLYYSHFTDLIYAQAAQSVAAGSPKESGLKIDLAAVLAEVRSIGRLTKNYLGILPPLAALVGLISLGLKKANDGLFLVLMAWFTTAAIFAAFGLVSDLTTRYHYFIVPAAAIAAGSLLSLLWRRGRAGYIVVSLALLAIAWQGLFTWYMRIMFTYH